MDTVCSIRPLVTIDIDRIHTLSHQLGYNVSRAILEQQIQSIIDHPDHQAFVAVKADKVLGYIHGFKALRLTTEPFLEIGALVVAPEERREGIGKALVAHLEKHALACAKIRVRCNRLRTGAHQFYQNLSYLERKEQKVFEKPLPRFS